MWPSALHRELAGETLVLGWGRWPFLFSPPFAPGHQPRGSAQQRLQLPDRTHAQTLAPGKADRGSADHLHGTRPTQRHSGRTPEALHRARDEEQRWRTTTISGGTTGTAEIDPGGTATVSRVATALRVGTAKVMVVGRPVLASSSAARAPAAIVRALDRIRWYVLCPRAIWLIDNRRGFAHRERLDV